MADRNEFVHALARLVSNVLNAGGYAPHMGKTLLELYDDADKTAATDELITVYYITATKAGNTYQDDPMFIMNFLSKDHPIVVHTRTSLQVLTWKELRCTEVQLLDWDRALKRKGARHG